MQKLALAVCFVVLAAPALAKENKAVAQLENAKGDPVGTVTLEEVPTGVKVTAQVRGLPPGEHGFHIHEKGECKAPDFKSAGGHWNPTSKSHGPAAPKGHHLGDMPNLWVNSEGWGKVTVFLKGATLEEGAKQSLFDKDGSAVMVHAGPDDYRSDPAGEAGARLACGVVARR